MTAERLQGNKSLWAARTLALVGAGVAGFLTFVHLNALYADSTTVVPLCGGAAWLDCDSVLNSKWSMWFGVPVAPIGLGVWVAAVVLLWLPVARRSQLALSVLMFLGLTLLGAAVLFTFIQYQELRTFCTWCMVDHVLGVIVCLLVLKLTFPLVKPKYRVAVAGAVIIAAVALVEGLGQTDSHAGPTFTIDVATDGGRWIETDDPTRAVNIGDDAVLDLKAHPVFAGPEARRFVFEVVDPKCKRCATFTPRIKQAMEQLGPRYGLILAYAPSEVGCNHYLQATPHYGEGSCALTRLALAVWLVDPDAHPVFHEWLMAEQDQITVDRASQRAQAAVGAQALEQALADPRIDQMIRRDLDLAVRLKIEVLPGLIAGSSGFRALPEEPSVLATLIKQLLPADNYHPPSEP